MRAAVFLAVGFGVGLALVSAAIALMEGIAVTGSVATVIYCTVCAGEREVPHVHCAECGAVSQSDLCSYHHVALLGEDECSVGNRIMCDLLHRGTVPNRVPLDDRPLASEFVAQAVVKP